MTLGSRQIEAAFEPREEDRLVFEPSTGTAPVSFRAISTSTLRCAPSPVVIGATTSCEVVVTHLADASESAHVPSGSVAFAVLGGRGSFGSSGRCNLVPRDDFSSSCRVDFTPEETIDTRTVITLYQGDDFNEGTRFLVEGTIAVEVHQDFRSTVVTVSCQPERVGLAEPSRCLARVADNNEGATSVSGSIVFERNAGDGGGDFSDDGACDLVREDPETATCELDYTPTVRGSGTHGIVARYSGDGGHVENSGTGQVLVKTPEEEEEDAKDPTTTTVKCQPSTLAVGRTSLCNATVEGTGANPSPLTGSIEFIDDGQGEFPEAICQVQPADGAKASCQTPYVPVVVGSGEHKITAAYSGDGSYRKSRGEATLNVGAIRFAAPGGVGADPCADRANPCSLFTAADVQAPGTTIKFGDEVVLLPGTYDNASGDLGPNRALSLPGGVSLHGEEDRARPVIKLSVNTVAGRAGFLLRSEDTVSRIEIDSTAVTNALDVAGVVDGVIVRSSAAAAIACINNQGTIRNSACLTSGPDSAAIAANSGGEGSRTVRLRNVTALSTGAGSIGLRYIARAGSNLTVDAKSVLTRGGATDVVARGLSDPPNTPGTGGKVAINLDHSDYVNVATATDAGGGIATVTLAGSDTNIVAEPKLAADQVHQLADSLTINAGATDEFSGPADIDGEQRAGDGIADIGADEFVISPTETRLTCDPDRVEVEDAARCTVTVTGTSIPTGEVEFSTGDPGDFDPIVCDLENPVGNSASCAVDYTPSDAARALHRLTATYKGTPEHEISEDRFGLGVIDGNGGGGNGDGNPTLTALECAPTTVILGGGSVCTATVEDDATTDRSVPTGFIEFESDRRGSFANACELHPSGQAKARCQIVYDPDEVGAHEIFAEYEGDEEHETSGDTTEITANARNGGRNTATALACEPSTVILGGVSICTVNVKDLGAAPVAPGGGVFFASDGGGEFSSAGCLLFATGRDEARCQLIY
ncbi:MAG: Ig-like domain-containing protein, partial [Solirubrobacterales bacterium]